MDEDDIGYDGAPKNAWMLTFADLVSLMLTFFVLLFSMSSVKVDKWDAMIDTMTQSLNPDKVKTVAAATAQFNIGTIFRKRATNLDYLAGVLDEAMAQDKLLSKAQLMRLDDRLVITLPSDLLFPAGKALMPAEARRALFDLGGVLRNISNQIGVNGHSDPAPPAQGGEYTSNWELSLARAAAVANALRRSGYRENIVAFGYSDSRYNQLPKLPDAERRKLARRVDIVIFPTVGEG